MPRKTKEDNQLMAALAQYGGGTRGTSSITFEGTRLVIPESWTPKKAVQTILEYDEEQNAYTRFSRDYRFRPWDGAAATERALIALTGGPGIQRGTPGFFGSNPPSKITIPTGVDSSIAVPWGRLYVPLFHDKAEDDEPWIEVGGYVDEEYGTLFRLTIYAPNRYEAHANGLLNLVQKELEERSIYKGKAFTGADMPEFLDVDAVDPAKVVYSDEVMDLLDSHLFGVIRYADEMKAEGISLKRSVLLHGPYGTGKTLGLMLTAREAVANGWTFILCRPGKDDPFEVMKTAQLYPPCAVAIEDVDAISRSESMSMDNMSRLLDVFDGMTAKEIDVLNVMTTNHEESITKGMLRPGRLDALIEIAHLDRNGVMRMVQSLVSENNLDHVNYDVVYEACEGYLPAFVAEAVTRAKNASIVRGKGTLLPLNTADIVNGAHSLRTQFEMMQRASEVDIPPTFDRVFRDTVRSSIHEMGVSLPDFEEGELLNN